VLNEENEAKKTKIKINPLMRKRLIIIK